MYQDPYNSGNSRWTSSVASASLVLFNAPKLLIIIIVYRYYQEITRRIASIKDKFKTGFSEPWQVQSRRLTTKSRDCDLIFCWALPNIFESRKWDQKSRLFVSDHVAPKNFAPGSSASVVHPSVRHWMYRQPWVETYPAAPHAHAITNNLAFSKFPHFDTWVQFQLWTLFKLNLRRLKESSVNWSPWTNYPYSENTDLIEIKTCLTFKSMSHLIRKHLLLS